MSPIDHAPDNLFFRRRTLRAASVIILGMLAVLIVGCSSGCSFGSPVDSQAGGPNDPRGNTGLSFDGQAGGPNDPQEIAESPSDGQTPDNPTVIVHAEEPDDPQEGSPVFQSYWSTATGTGDRAVGDGGRWDNFYCDPTARARVLSVVPGVQHGWTATPNVLQITNAGSRNCGMIENVSDVPLGADNYYVRMYIKVVGVQQGTGHSVVQSVKNPFGAVYWGVGGDGSGGGIVENVSYSPRFNIDPRVGMSDFGYEVRPSLNQGTWYRFEFRVEYYDPENPLRVRVWPFIYDMAGRLIADSDDYISNMFAAPTLTEDYAAGGYGTVVSRDKGRFFGLGYEGSAGNEDIGAQWYYAGMEVRTDRFPGPIQ